MDALSFERVGRGGIALVLMALGVSLASPAAGSIWRDREWTDVEGKTWTAEELEGRVVLLDFWATWCAPCLAELPNLRRLQAEHGDDGLVIVGIALDAIDRRGLRSFLLRHGIDWPQVHRPDGVASELARRFAVEAVPVTLLVDRQGRVIARDLRGEALARVVATLLLSAKTEVG